jgi:lipase
VNPMSNHPMVLVHGLIGHLKTVRDHPALASLRVIAPELLGYGANAHTPAERINLAAQAQELEREVVAAFGDEPVHVVGHSLGGAVAMLFAHRAPQRIASVTSIEGNFTLDDAFWSGALGRMSPEDATRAVRAMRADPKSWIEKMVWSPPAEVVDLAGEWLYWQPPSTVHAMSRAILAETGPASAYLEKVEAVFRRHPVHLLSGQRSHAEWHVPEWAGSLAASEHVFANAGHIPMLDAPDAFVGRLLWCLDTSSSERRP